MTTIRFDEVAHREQRRISCSGGCGKKLTRSHTFTQTINPFNKNAAGGQKTRSEILAELRQEGAAWAPTAMCPACDERVNGPKPVPPQQVLVGTPLAGAFRLPRSVVVEAGCVAEARDKAAERIRADIAVLQARLAAVAEWTYHCYPSKKCKHGDGPCFPQVARVQEAPAKVVAA